MKLVDLFLIGLLGIASGGAPLAEAASERVAAPGRQDRPQNAAVPKLILQSLGHERIDEVRMASSLARLTPSPAADLFRIATYQRIPAEWVPRAKEPIVLPGPQQNAVLAAFEHIPLRDVRPVFETLLTGEPDPRAQHTAMRIVGRIGRDVDIKLLVRLASAIEYDALPLSVREEFETALFGILERNKSGLWQLDTAFDDAHTSLLNPILRAVERARVPDTLLFLSNLLGRIAAVDPLVLSTISKVAGTARLPVSDEVRRLVRKQLIADDPRLLQEAARAAGALEDYEAVARLVELLEDSSRNVRWKAHYALQKITGLGYGPEQVRWARWYDEESRWWDQEASDLFDSLPGLEMAELAQAINEITRRKLNRHDLAAVLIPCLNREEPQMVRLTCESLAQLRSPVAQEPLTAFLDHRNEKIRGAAWTALKAITGRNLPPEPELWQSVPAGGVRGF